MFKIPHQMVDELLLKELLELLAEALRTLLIKDLFLKFIMMIHMDVQLHRVILCINLHLPEESPKKFKSLAELQLHHDVKRNAVEYWINLLQNTIS